MTVIASGEIGHQRRISFNDCREKRNYTKPRRLEAPISAPLFLKKMIKNRRKKNIKDLLRFMETTIDIWRSLSSAHSYMLSAHEK